MAWCGRTGLVWGSLWLALASVTGAQQALTGLHDDTLKVSISRPLPAAISRGMAAFYVELRNDGARGRDVELRFEPQRYRRSRFDLRAKVHVPAGESRRQELLLPAFLRLDSGQFEVRSGGEETLNYVSTGLHENAGQVQPVLILGQGTASASEVESWTERLSREEITGRGKPFLDLSASYVGPEDLPRRFESYSGLAALLVDTSLAPPGGPLEPAMRWVRLGGSVIFSGPNAAAYAESLPGVGPWMEERFRYVNAFQSAETGEVDFYHLGLGQLVIAQSKEFLAASSLKAIQGAIFFNQGFMPDALDSGALYFRALAASAAAAGTTNLSSGPLPSFLVPGDLDGVGELPYRLFILLLIVFFVVVAPLNFRLVKRSGRSAWLLFTIPTLAAVASLSFLGYGILSQGLGLVQSSHTYTVLDQREHRSQTLDLRTFFAGIAPRDGLLPAAGSLVIPISESGPRAPASYYRLDMGNSLALKGDYLPVRVESTQLVLSDRAARGRLEFQRTEAGFELTNALGASIQKLAMRAPGGQLFLFEAAAGAPLADGAKGRMMPAPASPPQLGAWLPGLLGGLSLGWADELPEGMYLAILESNPFADSTGLEPVDARGEHALFGVLPLDAEGWQ